ncbi:unnamed protein product [Ectocarpus sp. 12 AP-2014]
MLYINSNECLYIICRIGKLWCSPRLSKSKNHHNGCEIWLVAGGSNDRADTMLAVAVAVVLWF